jgi:ribosomal protein S18 acetylase RimI-like enzyme
MAEFYVSLSTGEMAGQIADLINTHNQLHKKHTAYSILNSAAKYFVEVINDKVIGCTALLKEETNLSRNFHTCVQPEFRRKGIAKKLKLLAIQNCDTGYIFSTVREDNIPSINMNLSLGYVFVNKIWSKNRYVLTLGRSGGY